ncbi:MAG: serine/threonine protein kinase [Thaumarchaeota archaeon]|nr:serine/threonine protein kinase [Nitrososphaerota archaeon]
MSGQPVERVRFAIRRLNQKGLTRQRRTNQVMLAAGLDLIAMKHFVDNNEVAALGKIIAKGKESDVYEVISESGELFALKMFRLGRTSFRAVRRKRREPLGEVHNWIARNYTAARREFAALKRLEGVTRNVPRALAFNRHALLLEELLGVRLSEKPPLRSPSELLRQILDAVRGAYMEARIVNGDLSEYNVLTDGKKAWLIDWPQWVIVSGANANDLLKRDVSSLTRFFLRAYGVKAGEEKAYRYVMGKEERLPIRRERSSASG